MESIWDIKIKIKGVFVQPKIRFSIRKLRYSPTKFVKFQSNGLRWKDKFSSPRMEFNPSFQLWLFNWQICFTFVAPHGDEDDYWEQILWWLYYYEDYGADQPDISKARNSWGWVDSKTRLSTWDDSFVIKKKNFFKFK